MNGIPFFPQRFFSHLLIVFMVIATGISSFYEPFISVFGFHKVPYLPQYIPQIIAQCVLFQFLHGNMLHLFMNSFFLYQAGPEIEGRMSGRRFRLFFVVSTVFIALSLVLFSPSSNTIGMSGFCMALLSYLWIDLFTLRHPGANQIGVMLFMNILLGFSSDISLTAHASGVVIGLLWWWGRKKFLRGF